MTTLEQEVDDFLEHFGAKGMKWGVRKNSAQSAAAARKKGMGPGQLRKEAKQVKAAGGGLKGTINARREMVKSGKLSRYDSGTGTLRFGRNVAVALLAGGITGHVVGKMLVKNIN